MINRIKQAWREHPVLDGLVGGIAIFIAAAALVSFVPPAWAAVSIPIGDRIVINLGAALDWAQFLLGAAGFWLIYKTASGAKAEAREAKVASLQAVKQTDGVLEKVAALSGNVAVAKERIEVAARKETARQDAVADAKVEADIEALKPSPHGERAAGKQPLPVADDRTAGAAERSATALERTAAATEDPSQVRGRGLVQWGRKIAARLFYDLRKQSVEHQQMSLPHCRMVAGGGDGHGRPSSTKIVPQTTPLRT